MSAFKFDPYAELARIQNQSPTPAIVATPATEQRLQVETVATVAGIAGSGVEIEKSSPGISDLFERIGIMDETGGAACHEAAAQDLGFDSFDDAIHHISQEWANHIRGSFLPCEQDARANWQQVEVAARYGWDEINLFGRYSGLINRLDGGVIKHVHRDYVTTECGAIYPRASRDGEWPIWEAGS